MTEKKPIDKNVQDRVNNITTRTFWITNCPELVWKDFNDFAKLETNNNYSVALKLLLGTYKTDAKSSVLYERFIDLNKRVNDIERGMATIADSIKTLGECISQSTSKEIEDEIEDLDEEPESKRVIVPTMGGNNDFDYKNKEVDE